MAWFQRHESQFHTTCGKNMGASVLAAGLIESPATLSDTFNHERVRTSTDRRQKEDKTYVMFLHRW